MARQTNTAPGLQQLKAAIKTGSFGKLYFFYGEERYLQEYYLNTLKKKLVSGPMEDFNYRRLTAENMSIEALQDAVEAVPMMAEWTMVQVDDYDPFAQNEETREKLIALFAGIPEGCCVVFNYDTTPYGRNGKLKKLCDAIKQNGCEVEFAKQSPAELSDWIARHFKHAGKTITPDLCQYLVFLTGGDMTSLLSEIQKIAAYSQAPAIVRQDIDMMVEPVLTAVIFDITDAMAENNYDAAMGKLYTLLHMKEDPIAILAAVGGHFRKLMTAKTVLSAGHGADVLMGMIGTNSDYYARKIIHQAGRLREEFCCKAVTLCYEADCKMKRSFDDSQRVLELLILELAQEAAK